MLFNLIYTKSLILTLLMGLLMGVSHISAQDVDIKDDEEYTVNKLRFVEFTMDRLYPVQTFKSSLDQNLWGFKLGYLVQLKKEKLDYMGFQLNFSQLGTDSNSFFDSTVRTSSNFVGAYLTFRHFPNLYFWRIEPFAEVALGPQFFYTQTTTSFFDVDSTNDIDFDEVDTSLGYGIGVGFMLHITGQVFFTAQANYFGGTAVTYLVERGNQFVFPLDNFGPETSQTNFIKLQFGISISI